MNDSRYDSAANILVYQNDRLVLLIQCKHDLRCHTALSESLILSVFYCSVQAAYEVDAFDNGMQKFSQPPKAWPMTKLMVIMTCGTHDFLAS